MRRRHLHLRTCRCNTTNSIVNMNVRQHKMLTSALRPSPDSCVNLRSCPASSRTGLTMPPLHPFGRRDATRVRACVRAGVRAGLTHSSSEVDTSSVSNRNFCSTASINCSNVFNTLSSTRLDCGGTQCRTTQDHRMCAMRGGCSDRRVVQKQALQQHTVSTCCVPPRLQLRRCAAKPESPCKSVHTRQ